MEEWNVQLLISHFNGVALPLAARDGLQICRPPARLRLLATELIFFLIQLGLSAIYTGIGF